MRRFVALVRTSALELVSEPVVLLTLWTAIALAVFAPALHYHQFGDPTRMARDAGFSALLVGGVVLAAFGGIRTLRREIESGTALCALAHPVSRRMFFLGKVAGSAVVLLLFFVTVASVSLTIVDGAAIGGAVAAPNGDIARLWGPSYALGVSALVVPMAGAAMLNRFARCRYVPTAFALTVLAALAGTLYRFDAGLAVRLASADVLVAVPAFVFLSAASAFAVRGRVGPASALTGLTVCAFLPALGNYCLGDILNDGSTVSAAYVCAALAAAVPAVAGFLALGVRLFSSRDFT